MAQTLARTCWRGLIVAHPREWEAAVLAGPDEPVRCVLADRHYQRLDVRRQDLKYVPDLDLVLTKHLGKAPAGKKSPLSPLTDLPEPWKGLSGKGDDSTVVQAARCFPDQRVLIEATIVWPGRRNTELEQELLRSIALEDPDAAERQWDALGLWATVGRRFDLAGCEFPVGKVQLDFRAAGKAKENLSLQRMAMPGAWLKGPLADWMLGPDQLAPRTKVLRQERTIFNSHSAERLIASGWAGTVAALRGRRKVRLDLAWQCPVEDRLYRITYCQVTRDREIVLPEDLGIRCCRPAAVVVA